MATTISSIDTSISKLVTSFQTAIKTTIEAESEPLKRVQTLKDSLDIRRGVYTDVKINLDALQSSIQALISSQASYGLNLTSKASVTPGTSGTTVLTITNASESAAASDYDISVSKLAKAQSRATTAFSSAEVALAKSGTFWLGGTGTASLDMTAGTSVTNAVISSAADGQRELGSGDYTVQVRQSGDVRQFRIVNADGNAVAIRKSDGSSGTTTAWQTMTSGDFDTGRGQTLTFNTAGDVASATFHYNAKGTSITVSKSDTPRNIITAINAATQPEGRDFRASIVANQIVLTAAQTGVNHTMLFSDGAGLGFDTVLQDAQNAQFTINGMTVSRASNTNLSDVVDGVTISLAGDAEGKTARLSVTANTDKASGLISSMVTKFNTALNHLRDKMASTAKTENGKTSYTRGVLGGDTVFSGFRTDMMYRMGRNYTNSGAYKNLEKIGISFDKDMKMTFDSATFSDALKNNAADVTALLDKSMGEINTLLSRYTGSTGMLNRSLTSMESQGKEYEQRITKYNTALETRKQSLYKMYVDYQAQLVELGNTATMFGIDLGSTVNKSG